MKLSDPLMPGSLAQNAVKSIIIEHLTIHDFYIRDEPFLHASDGSINFYIESDSVCVRSRYVNEVRLF